MDYINRLEAINVVIARQSLSLTNPQDFGSTRPEHLRGPGSLETRSRLGLHSHIEQGTLSPRPDDRQALPLT